MQNNYRHKDESNTIGTWNQQIGRLKRAFGSLTNADLNYEESRKSDLVAALEVKLGVTQKVILDTMARAKSSDLSGHYKI